MIYTNIQLSTPAELEYNDVLINALFMKIQSRDSDDKVDKTALENVT